MNQREIYYDDALVSPLHTCSTLDLTPLAELELGETSFDLISPISEGFVPASYAGLTELYPRAKSLFRRSDATSQDRKQAVGKGWDNRPRHALPFAQPRLPHASAWWQVT